MINILIIFAAILLFINRKSKNMYHLPITNNGTYITSPFGKRIHPIHNIEVFHNGIDIGTGGLKLPIFTIADGTVLTAAYSTHNGNYVIIQHDNNVKSYYLHLHTKEVKAGDKITRGQRIGTAGATGSATAVHLHFEYRVDNVPQDPEKVFLNKYVRK